MMNNAGTEWNPFRKKIFAVGLFLTLVLLGAHAREYAFLTDDAFISFRYARNLAEGNGLVFNPGLERVEGYTNFLWVLILAGFDWMGLAPEHIANVLTLLFTLGLWGLVVGFVLREESEPQVDRLLVPSLFRECHSQVVVAERPRILLGSKRPVGKDPGDEHQWNTRDQPLVAPPGQVRGQANEARRAEKHQDGNHGKAVSSKDEEQSHAGREAHKCEVEQSESPVVAPRHPDTRGCERDEDAEVEAKTEGRQPRQPRQPRRLESCGEPFAGFNPFDSAPLSTGHRPCGSHRVPRIQAPSSETSSMPLTHLALFHAYSRGMTSLAGPP